MKPKKQFTEFFQYETGEEEEEEEEEDIIPKVKYAKILQEEEYEDEDEDDGDFFPGIK